MDDTVGEQNGQSAQGTVPAFGTVGHRIDDANFDPGTTPAWRMIRGHPPGAADRKRQAACNVSGACNILLWP